MEQSGGGRLQPHHQLAKLHHHHHHQQQMQQQHQSPKVRFSPNPKTMNHHQQQGNAMSNNNNNHRHSPYKADKLPPPSINSDSHFAASKFCTTPAPSSIPAPPEKWLASAITLLSTTNSANGMLNGLSRRQAFNGNNSASKKKIQVESDAFSELMSKIKSTTSPIMPSKHPSHMMVPSFPDDPAVLRVETCDYGQVISIGSRG